jgi:hypothetical protein
LNDYTVPEKQHIGDSWNDDDMSNYPDHTRLVERSFFTVGVQAYAVSLPGARKMLYESGIRRNDKASKALRGRQSILVCQKRSLTVAQ